MSDILMRVCALSLICVAVGVVVRQIRGEISFAIRAAGAVLIFCGLMISVEPLLEEMKGLFVAESGGEYAEVMIRALGIAILTQITSGICRDCGESGAAAGVELAGKLEILWLCIPIVRAIIGYASEIMSFEG